jgi:hypothetical protein
MDLAILQLVMKWSKFRVGHVSSKMEVEVVPDSSHHHVSLHNDRSRQWQLNESLVRKYAPPDLDLTACLVLHDIQSLSDIRYLDRFGHASGPSLACVPPEPPFQNVLSFGLSSRSATHPAHAFLDDVSLPHSGSEVPEA